MQFGTLDRISLQVFVILIQETVQDFIKIKKKTTFVDCIY